MKEMKDNKEKNTKNEEAKKNIHTSHRKRMKERFLSDGMGNMSDHNILEMLLFYSIPRKDTNPTAHLLIEKFGSLSAVFDASVDELMKIPGITENSAVLIKMIPSLFSAYMTDKSRENTEFSDVDSIGKYLVGYYLGKTDETVVIVLFSEKKMIYMTELSSGTGAMSDVNFRKIAELALSKGATSFVIAHNHPRGKAKPSKEDMSLTSNLIHAFEMIDLSLREHIIVSGNEYYCILKNMYR